MVTWRVLSIQFRAQVPTTSPAVEVEVGWGGGGGEHPDPVPDGGGVLTTMDGWLGMSTTP